MAPKRLAHLLMCLFFILPLVGCLPSTVKTDHPYVLLRQQDHDYAILEDDDPLFTTLDEQVFADAYLPFLRAVFDHTTAAIIATDTPTTYPQTIANKLFIVVDSDGAGVGHKIEGQFETATVPVELALGLGRGGQVDTEWARWHFPRAVGQLLLELVGLPAEEALDPQPLIHELASPQAAFYVGWQAALDALYAQAHPACAVSLRAKGELTAQERDLLRRYQDVPRNGLRYRYDGERPTAELRSPQEAMRTPSVVAAFFFQLLQGASGYYPQREMLWFANYEQDDRIYGQILLAASRMDRQDVSIQAYIRAYVETFPAERDAVLALAERTFGGDPLPLPLPQPLDD